MDPVAVSYVLQNSDSFQKSELLRFSLGVFTGKGMHDSPFWGLILILTHLDISEAYYLSKVRSCAYTGHIRVRLTPRTVLGPQHKKQVSYVHMFSFEQPSQFQSPA